MAASLIQRGPLRSRPVHLRDFRSNDFASPPNNRLEKDLRPAQPDALGVNRKEGMKMTRVRVEGFTISLDGFGAGPNQDIRNPLGVGGTELHQWLVPTRTLQRTLFGADGGTTGIDDDFAARRYLAGPAGRGRATVRGD